MKSIRYTVPAKINIYLRLTGKRTDGYNNLCTVFQKISIADTLTLRTIPRGFTLEVTGASPCAMKDNLVYKAYSLLKKKTQFRGGISCTLRKNIPAGSGLGGASADAAYMLMGINKLYSLGLSTQDLADLGGKLGADVPFFIYPYSLALGVERGDALIPLNGPKTPLWLLLVVFDKPLATKDVYHAYHYPAKGLPNLTKLSHDVIMLSHFLCEKDVQSLGSLLQNDLMTVAGRLMPEIHAVISEVKRAGYPACSMSGSGPTVYALFRQKNHACAAQRMLSGTQGIRTYIEQTVHY